MKVRLEGEGKQLQCVEGVDVVLEQEFKDGLPRQARKIELWDEVPTLHGVPEL
jgi:hypothetical protein